MTTSESVGEDRPTGDIQYVTGEGQYRLAGDVRNGCRTLSAYRISNVWVFDRNAVQVTLQQVWVQDRLDLQVTLITSAGQERSTGGLRYWCKTGKVYW